MSITQPPRRGAIALGAVIIRGATASVAVHPLSTRAAVADEPAVAWIDRNAVPVRLDASGPVEDLRPLRGIVRGARIVGLGEPSHRLVLSLPARPSRMDRGYAIQHANAILGFYETYAEDMATVSAPVRDRHIADTISWWQRRTRQRIVYGAANVHTTAIPQVTWTFPSDNVTFTNKVMAGGHLRLRYGRSYVSIATVSRTGRILGGFESGRPSVFTVPPPRPPAVDHVLGQARHRTYLLDLHAPASPQVRRWLDAPATMRLIGSAYDVGKDADFTMTVGSFRRGFDAVLRIGAVTPTRPLDQ